MSKDAIMDKKLQEHKERWDAIYRSSDKNQKLLKDLWEELNTWELHGFRGSKEELFKKKIRHLARVLTQFFEGEFKYEDEYSVKFWNPTELKIKDNLTDWDYESFHREYATIRKITRQYFTRKNKKKEKDNKVIGIYLKKQKDRLLKLLYRYAYYE